MMWTMDRRICLELLNSMSATRCSRNQIISGQFLRCLTKITICIILIYYLHDIKRLFDFFLHVESYLSNYSTRIRSRKTSKLRHFKAKATRIGQAMHSACFNLCADEEIERPLSSGCRSRTKKRSTSFSAQLNQPLPICSCCMIYYPPSLPHFHHFFLINLLL